MTTGRLITEAELKALDRVPKNDRNYQDFVKAYRQALRLYGYLDGYYGLSSSHPSDLQGDQGASQSHTASHAAIDSDHRPLEKRATSAEINHQEKA